MTRALLLAFLGSMSVAQAQQPDSTPRTPQDFAIQRARKLIDADNTAEGRKVLDSLLKALPPDHPAYAEALYWRGASAPTAVDAERDYRRLLVEAPLAPRAEDAMLQLAQLEQARGDRRSASDHLQRFLISFPNNPARPRVAVSLVRLLFDQGLVARGCDALRMGREAVPQQNLELRNQLEFYAPRCVVLEAPSRNPTPNVAPSRDTASRAPSRAPSRDTASRAPTRDTASRAPTPVPPSRAVPSPSPSPSPAAPAAPAPSTSPKPANAPPSTAKAGASFYSVQVAAYDLQESAARLASTLMDRGLEARVDGAVKPFRVRIGKYATRAEAVKAAATLKAQGMEGFVTLVSP
ncbi:MAG TPA: SPOR domain-containing protein [Gemmatimonadaceae bacterium]|nr:SPOR domain-containing protein [Gemmatimonadaceae bacterium]